MEQNMRAFVSNVFIWLMLRTTPLHSIALRSEAHIGKFHSFIERNFVHPNLNSCPRGIRIGYFEVAADCDIPELKNMSNITPTPTRVNRFGLEFGFQNIWVLDYMKLCSQAQLELKMDEDFSFKQSLCALAKFKDYTAEIKTELSVGFHIIRTLVVLNAPNIFRSLIYHCSLISRIRNLIIIIFPIILSEFGPYTL